MNDLLFDVPWWLPTMLAVAGISFLVSGNRRQDRRRRDWGAGLVALAIGWSVMSYLVDTDKEKCQKQTRRFVQTVVDQDWNTFDALLDPDVDFRFAGSSWSIVGRETLDSALKADMGHIGLKTAHITHVAATQSTGTVTVSITVWSTQSATMDQPLDSEWELDWQRSGSRWLLHEVRAIRVSQMTAEEVRSALPVR